MNVKEMDSTFLARDSPAEDVQVVKSSGSVLISARDRRYIDFLMGWCVGNLGWDHIEIRSQVRRSRSPAYVNPAYLYKPWAELARLLADITPGRLKKSFRATGGTEAVEVAIQIAMLSTKRDRFCSIEGSYHGNSIGAMSIASSDYRKQYKNLLNGCQKVRPPLNDKALDKVEKMLSRRNIAAFIMEPIICNLGVLIPEKEFMVGVQSLCRQYGTLLIVDEVAAGFGRTGRLFASEHFDMEPDIMCLAKAITGGYAPLGATVTTDKVAESIQEEFSFYSTYGWHPLSVDAAITNIRYLVKHKARLLANVSEMSHYFESRLSRMKFKYPARIRIKGLAIGVEVSNADYVSKRVDKCRQAGLLITAEENVLLLFPALNIDQKIAEKGLDILESCL
ncbi:MAG TPA: aspartate aminotransferase family protein [Nitrospirales bacterium]